MSDDGRITEEAADAILTQRDEFWKGRELSGQMLLNLEIPRPNPLDIKPLAMGNAGPTQIDWTSDDLKPVSREPGAEG